MDRRLSVIRIDVPAPESARLQHFCLEAPIAGASSDSFGLRFLAWFIASDLPVKQVSIDYGGEPLDTVKVVERRDVENAFPESNRALVGGFEAVAPIVGIAGEVTLTVMFHFATGATCAALVTVMIHPLSPGFVPRRNPLLLTCSGRVGSTVTMELLANHPAIISQGHHPFEDKSALFWMRACSVLTMPSDRIRSTRGLEFEYDRFSVGFNPFCTDLTVPPGNAHTRRWPGETLPGMMYDHFMRVIDSYYDAVAADAAKADSIYFVEKAAFGMLPAMMRELYPGSREVFLIRDPRDMYASICAFNRKRGFPEFFAERFETEAEHIDFLGAYVQQWVTAWERRKNSSILIKYEDLIANPARVACRLFEYLGVSRGEEEVSNAVENAFRDSSVSRFHMTSADLQHSTCRWRSDLSPEIIERCNSAFEPVIRHFGYE